MRATSHSHRRGGFTLIELMIASLMMGILTVYMLQSFSVNQRNYVMLDQTVETQQNLRAIGDLIGRDIRHAGFMVPAGAGVCGVDLQNAPDLLYISDADALDPTGKMDADMGAGFGGNNVASGVLNLDPVLEEPDQPFYDTDADGVMDSDFQIGGGVIVVDKLNPARGAACGRVTNVSPGTNQITIALTTGPLGPTGAATDLVAVPAHEYQLNAQQMLLRDGLILAQGVEDLQVAYFFDDNNDNLVDPGDYRGVLGNNYLASALDGSDLREMRVNIVVRTRAQDVNFTQGQFQTTENRAAVAGNDGFRRRVYTSTALLRNIAHRTVVF